MSHIPLERQGSHEPGFGADAERNRRTRHGSDIEHERGAPSDSDEERTPAEHSESESEQTTPPVDETDVLSMGGPDSLQDVEQAADDEE